MITVVKFNSIADIQALQELACESKEDVYLHSMDNKIMVDAKSFINLFTLDLTDNVQVVSEDEKVHAQLKKMFHLK